MKNREPRTEPVPEAASHRLSLLLRSLRSLEAAGVLTTSSYEIAARFSLNPSRIRKDLALFGEFGVRGVGYPVAGLKAHLEALMGLDLNHMIGIAGAGKLGQALADSPNFNAGGFEVAALFDVDGRKVGSRSCTGVPIHHVRAIEGFVKELGIEIGILAIPAEDAIPLAQRMAEAGVRAILNFAPVTVPALPGVLVKNLDLTFFLENLSFGIAIAKI